MKTIALAFMRLFAAAVIGYGFYWLLGVSVDRVSRTLSHDSRLRQLLEWLLALIGPLGLGLVLIVVFVVAAFLLLPRFVPALRVRKPFL